MTKSVCGGMPWNPGHITQRTMALAVCYPSGPAKTRKTVKTIGKTALLRWPPGHRINLINPSKNSISVAANGYVPMSARRGRTPGSAGFQYQTLGIVVKQRFPRWRLHDFWWNHSQTLLQTVVFLMFSGSRFQEVAFSEEMLYFKVKRNVTFVKVPQTGITRSRLWINPSIHSLGNTYVSEQIIRNRTCAKHYKHCRSLMI